MASPEEREGLSFDTGEFRAIAGGDGDYTGVDFSGQKEGTAPTSAHVKVEPVPEGQQFPSQVRFYGD